MSDNGAAGTGIATSGIAGSPALPKADGRRSVCDVPEAAGEAVR